MTAVVAPVPGRTFRLNGKKYTEREFGFDVEFLSVTTRFNVRLPIYSAAYLKRDWPNPTDKRTLAELCLDVDMKNEDMFFSLDADEDKAVRMAALYCRHIQNVPETIFFRDGKIHFHIGLKVQASTHTSRFSPAYIRSQVHMLQNELVKTPEVPLLAEEVEKLFEQDFKTPYRFAKDSAPGSITLSKPVLYLEIDNVLVFEPEVDKHRQAWRDAFPEGEPVPGAKEFLEWAVGHFECRWLSNRAVFGEMMDFEARKLSRAIGVEPSFLKNRIRNPLGCWAYQLHKGVNFAIDNWAWVATPLSPVDAAAVKEHNAEKKLYGCDARKNPGDLIRVWHELKNDFLAAR